MNDQSEPLITTRSLTRTFATGQEVTNTLKDITLTVNQGHLVCISGVSGSGKTTLFHLLTSLDKPTSGDVWFEDIKVSSLSKHSALQYRKSSIGIIFQDPYLIPSISVSQNIALPLGLKDISEKVKADRVSEVLYIVGITDRQSQMKPQDLSRGQQQKVSIARAIANDPPLILADEPTSKLDTTSVKEIMYLLTYLVESKGKTAIVMTNDDLATRKATVQLHLSAGQLITPTFANTGRSVIR